jgi:hypothetical protein
MRNRKEESEVSKNKNATLESKAFEWICFQEWHSKMRLLKN